MNIPDPYMIILYGPNDHIWFGAGERYYLSILFKSTTDWKSDFPKNEIGYTANHEQNKFP